MNKTLMVVFGVLGLLASFLFAGGDYVPASILFVTDLFLLLILLTGAK